VLCLVVGFSATPWPGGPFEDMAGADGAPACFGAAARDPDKPCVNRKLAFKAMPSPRNALLQPSAPCTVIRRKAPEVCAFGVSPKVAAPTVALLGDSHAVHWRAALAVAARTDRWRGVSITRSRCPFSLAKKPSRRCIGWVRRVLLWLEDHPDVRTVFVSADSASGVSATPDQFEATKIGGFIRAWKALPPSVSEVFVLHDVPNNGKTTAGCVERAVARHRNAGVRCARPRGTALRTDHQAVAAAQSASDRAELIDLTPHMCDEQKCFPVVGGALVIKDVGHLTRTFSTTLGLYLRRAVSRLRAPP